MKTLCLVMIVKDEESIIRRCLDSVKHLIGHWSICDTGSTDRTREIIPEILEGIPGELHDVPWVNFGHNRTEGMRRAKGKADYHLLLDADMTLHATEEFRHLLTADAYFLPFDGPIDYSVIRLASDRHDWHYVGATHEHVCSTTAGPAQRLRTVHVKDHADGRSRAVKYARDIELLKGELQVDPANSRSTFYLAQSYRELGFAFQAVEQYAKRATMGGWDEEVWYSKYQIARAQHASAMEWPQVLHGYLDAFQYRPSRLEPLLPVARHYRETGQYQLGFLFSRLSNEVPYPEDILFIERSVYEHALPLEYALCCAGMQLHQEAVRVCDQMLALPSLPTVLSQTIMAHRERSRRHVVEMT